MGRKRSRDDEQEEVVHAAKKPLRHRATVVGRNGNVWVVSTTRPPVISSSTESDSTSSVTHNGGKSSSISKHLHSWARMKEGKQHQIHNNHEKRSNVSDSDSTKWQHAQEDSRATSATTPTNAFAYRRRQKNVILCQTVLFFVLITFFLVSIMYTLNVSHNLQMLQNDSMHRDTIDKYNTILQERERKYQHVKSHLNTAEDKAKQSQLTITSIVEEMTESDRSYKTLIEDYKAIAQQHDDDKNDALSRIAALRSQKEDSSSALDLAWLRMDDLLQENNDLSSQLKVTKKKLESNIKHLTLERDNLLQRRDVLEERNKKLQAQNEIQQYTHEYTMNLFFAPMLRHTLHLQQTSEHQHSIIVDLTSIVRDLHESLENRETDLDTQIVFAHAQSKVHEMERVSLMQSMEAQLQQLEEEAVGAVNAVATASGKLEFERKSEEQTRWNEYVSQVESILGDMSSETGDGIIETSVLRTAITRRVESGLNALKKYVHPNHFVNKKDDDSLFSMQIEF
eukprot:scaffold8289_cov85-Skeletonema_marinoi.AAC.3